MLYRYHNALVIGLGDHVIWSKIGHFIIIAYLGSIGLAEFRDQKLLIEKTPISPYHRLEHLPERLHGAILVIDLKNSEALLKAIGC